MKCVLIHVQPYCSRLATRIARATSPVHTDEARPYSESFAQRDRLVGVREAGHRDHRPEHLALHDLVRLQGAGDDRGFVEEPGARRAPCRRS